MIRALFEWVLCLLLSTLFRFQTVLVRVTSLKRLIAIGLSTSHYSQLEQAVVVKQNLYFDGRSFKLLTNSVYQLLRPRSLSIGRFWGKDGSEKGRELSLLPLPPPPSKISSHLAPSEGLTLRLKAEGNTYPLINL